MAKIEVLPMRAADAADAARLEALCFSPPRTEKALLEELRDPLHAIFAAFADGEFAGYAGMRYAADEGYVDDVAVLPQFRRRGVGNSLVTALLQYAGAKELAFLSLEARASNTPALALYRQLGFEEAGRRKGFYTQPAEDAVILTKPLFAAAKSE